jgi:hypothetical protein
VSPVTRKQLAEDEITEVVPEVRYYEFFFSFFSFLFSFRVRTDFFCVSRFLSLLPLLAMTAAPSI